MTTAEKGVLSVREIHRVGGAEPYVPEEQRDGEVEIGPILFAMFIGWVLGWLTSRLWVIG